MAALAREIIETLDAERGVRSHRYRWTVAGGTDENGKSWPSTSGEEWASERVTPIPAEVLEDRWIGLMGDGDSTELLERLDAVLTELADGLTRRQVGTDTVVVDGKIVGIDGVIDIDGLEKVIKAWLVERAAKVAA